ncbi:MAG: hypothetical protein K6U03_11795, partial [Firmicutes bacterium]|nr:hypothetical protein [Bacillota bacterium]
MALRWLLASLAWNVAVIGAYALLWRRRKDVAAHVYVHKGAIWSVWLSSWLFFLGYLAMGPMAVGLHAALIHPAALARAILAFLGLLACIYLAYLLVVYPFFASLRPALSKESLGFDWQLDVYVEDKVVSLVEETPMAPLILLGMGLAEVLKEAPREEWPELLKNLWLHYVPVVT